jgi:sphingosine kinase
MFSLLLWFAIVTLGGVAVLYAVSATANTKRKIVDKRRVADFVARHEQARQRGDTSGHDSLQCRLNEAARLARPVGATGAAAAAGHVKDAMVLAIVNPHGGKLRAVKTFRRVLQPMCEALGVRLELRMTTRAGHAVQLAREAAESGEVGAIITLSGDGMVHEVVTGIVEAGARTAVGVMPCGSSNGLAQSLYGTVDAVGVAERLLAGAAAQSSNLVELHTLDAPHQRFYDIMGVQQAVVATANYLCEDKLRWMNWFPFGKEVKDLLAAVLIIGRMRPHPVHIAMHCVPLTAEEISSDRYRDPNAVAGVRRLAQPPTGAAAARGPAAGPDTDPRTGGWFEMDSGWSWLETCNVSHIASDCQPAPGNKASGGYMDILVSRGHTRCELAAGFLKSDSGDHIHVKTFMLYKVDQLIFTPRFSSHEYYMSGELVAKPCVPAACRCIPDGILLWY